MKTPEEGYALGWADAIYAYESKQKKNMSTLPPLPEQAFIVDRGESFKVFTADQMRAYGEACAAAERERLIVLADDMLRGVDAFPLIEAIRERG